jgi:hypothetical protein
MTRECHVQFCERPRLQYLGLLSPDYVVMETLAGGDPTSICEQFEILAEHPKQVIFLKSTHAISGLRAQTEPWPLKAAHRQKSNGELWDPSMRQRDSGAL